MKFYVVAPLDMYAVNIRVGIDENLVTNYGASRFNENPLDTCEKKCSFCHHLRVMIKLDLSSSLTSLNVSLGVSVEPNPKRYNFNIFLKCHNKRIVYCIGISSLWNVIRPLLTSNIFLKDFIEAYFMRRSLL